MRSVPSRRRLCSISSRSTPGLPSWNPPFVPTTGRAPAPPASASPIVVSLSPPTYRWAVSTCSILASTACLTNATFSGVCASRFVPRPMRVTSTPPSATFVGLAEAIRAEREGFEPSRELSAPYSLSRRVPSATRPPLRDTSDCMRRVLVVCFGLVILVLVLSQLFLPLYLEGRVEGRLTREGGKADVTLKALPALT